MNAMRAGAAILAVALSLGAGGAAAGEPTRPTLRPIRPAPPLRVTLEAAPATDGAVALVATVHVGARLVADPVLRLTLSEGARLVEGRSEETLPRLAPGETLSRRFVVAGAARAEVGVGASGPAGGASARAAWPAAAAAAEPRVVPAVVPESVPIRPVRLPGVMIHRSIPLRPAPE
jgi:hypothetical protein